VSNITENKTKKLPQILKLTFDGFAVLISHTYYNEIYYKALVLVSKLGLLLFVKYLLDYQV
jgi:hypothetical protein